MKEGGQWGALRASALWVQGEREVPGRWPWGCEQRTQVKRPSSAGVDMSFESLDKLNVWSHTFSQTVGFRRHFSRRFLQRVLSELVALRICLMKDLDIFLESA